MRTADHFYLRSNVIAEPLIDRWYAWPHLIQPATAARNLTARHLPIMESYIRDPLAHQRAAATPALAGGPFMNYTRDRAAEVAALRDRTRETRRDLIELSSAIAGLGSLMREHATGYSLDPLYDLTPHCLRGYVEFAYDLFNQPSFRFIEPLLYTSRFYQRSSQSFALSIATGDDRPFIFSTPRLGDAATFQWQVPFDSEAVERLFGLRRRPAPYGAIKELLNPRPEQLALMDTFLTDRPPASGTRYGGAGTRWRYFGHACVLVESEDCTILTDPAISYAYPGASPRYTYEDLPDVIDFVLLTHAHQDHVLFETLLQLRDRIRTVLVPRDSGGYLHDPSLKLILRACGFKQVIDLAEMEELTCGRTVIRAIPFTGEHCDLAIQCKTAWQLKMANHSFLFAADLRNLNPALYRRVHCATGDIDTLFVGMECDGAPLSWIYGPLLTRPLARDMDHSRRANASDCDSALSLARQFNCSEVYVYAMGQEPWLRYISSIHYDDSSNPIVESNRLVERSREYGMAARRLYGCAEQEHA